MHTEDRRNVIELSRHLDSQMISDAEIVARENRVEESLSDMVEDKILDSQSDELIDAIISNPDAWRDFVNSVPCTDNPYSLDEAAQASRNLNRSVKKLIDALEGHMRESLRDEAEEAAR